MLNAHQPGLATFEANKIVTFVASIIDVYILFIHFQTLLLSYCFYNLIFSFCPSICLLCCALLQIYTLSASSPDKR